MASYRILLKPSVEKDLRSLPKGTVNRLINRIEALAMDPLPRQSVKLTGAEHSTDSALETTVSFTPSITKRD